MRYIKFLNGFLNDFYKHTHLPRLGVPLQWQLSFRSTPHLIPTSRKGSKLDGDSSDIEIEKASAVILVRKEN